MPIEANTISARRYRTGEAVPRRTIRCNRAASSSVGRLAFTRSATYTSMPSKGC